MGGKNIDQFQARQKSKNLKGSQTGTEASKNASASYDKDKSDQ
ncbi:MAG: hypothetical protein H6Q74_1991 [Firmicutes bacterium]|nr:hypothetical protein [Bacillota bacterium]